MSGQLLNSPAQIIAQLLISFGLGNLPVAGQTITWPIYYSNFPDEPDEAICVKDTTGLTDGRRHFDGTTNEHYGLQVEVRSLNEANGQLKANALVVALDQRFSYVYTTISPCQYQVSCVSRTSTVIPFGKELPNTERKRFSINATADITLVSDT